MTHKTSGAPGQPTKVLVGGHDQKFWFPLQRELEKAGIFEFREDLWSGHETHDSERSLKLLEWADVVVAEWALGNAVWYSEQVKPRQSLIVRLHLQERTTSYPDKIRYENVDAVVFVGAHILRECVEKFPLPENKAVVIGNFVDCGKYQLPKYPEARFNLGILGILPSRKRLDLAIETLRELLRYDDRYCLHVKGDSPEDVGWLWARTAEREYFQSVFAKLNRSELRNRVVFDPKGDDVAAWLRIIGYVLSPSDFESFHMAVAEGAASEAVPIVWNWHGASSIYPGMPLISEPAEAAAYIHHLSVSAERKRLQVQLSRYVSDRYGVEAIRSSWTKLMREGLTESAAAEADRVINSVLVVWAIDEYNKFHRAEMLRALSSNLGSAGQVMVIEPGNHYATLLSLGRASEEELMVFASGGVVRESPNLVRTRLLTGGVPEGVRTSLHQGEAVEPFRILDRLVKKTFGEDIRVVHWIYKPDQVDLLKPGEPFIYEAYDDYALDFGSGAPLPEVQIRESRVLRQAAHVFFTSRELARRKAGGLQNCSTVGNGVDFDTFHSQRVEGGRSGRPCVGYLGNLSDFFDWELLEVLAGELIEYDFILHGGVEEDKLGDRVAVYHRLRAAVNVRFTGWMSRASGAAAINRYDVLIIPFLSNNAMLAVNPLKLWEYFATGLPVVASPIDVSDVQPGCLQVVETRRDWIEAIRNAVSEEDAALRQSRIQQAKAHSWQILTQDHAKIVLQLWNESPTRTEPR